MTDTVDEVQTETKERRLVSVRIEGLFGNLTHFIPLNVESGITILTGPNGCGKTTILRLMEACTDFDTENSLRVLLDVPYREIAFGFDDAMELAVIRIDDANELKNGKPATPLKGMGGLGYRCSGNWDSKPRRNKIFSTKCALQFVERSIADRSIIKSYTTGIFDPNIEYYDSVLLNEIIKIPRWIGGLGVKLISTERIEQQRTIRYLGELKKKDSYDPEELAIEKIGEKFIKRVLEAKAIVSKMANKLGRSRKRRVIARAELEADYAGDELNVRLQKITDKQKRLNEAGILAGDFSSNGKMTGAAMATLSIYVEDEEQKIGVFDELLRQTELFQKIVNSRLDKKTMVLKDAEGLKVINFDSGESVPLHLLSSGEQHEINLFFDLIFNTSTYCLVLVDEPELSLHIAWQLKFIDDISKVRQLNGCQFLLATHSPAIIDDHWDYVVELEV